MCRHITSHQSLTSPTPKGNYSHMREEIIIDIIKWKEFISRLSWRSTIRKKINPTQIQYREKIVSNPSLTKWRSLSLSSTSAGYEGVVIRRGKILGAPEERLLLLLRISSLSLLDETMAAVLWFHLALHKSCPFWRDGGGGNYTTGTIRADQIGPAV